MTGQSGGGGLQPTQTVGGVLTGLLTAPSFATNGTTPILGTVTGFLGADVTMTAANQFFDGPTLAITAGKWLFVAHICYTLAALGSNLTARLWDGTTSYDSSISTIQSGGAYGALPLCAVITAAGPLTIRAALASTATGASIKAAAVNNPAGTNASSLVALRVA